MDFCGSNAVLGAVILPKREYVRYHVSGKEIYAPEAVSTGLLNRHCTRRLKASARTPNYVLVPPPILGSVGDSYKETISNKGGRKLGI